MVWVDDMYTITLGNFKGMKMSHMVADTHDELVAMARKVHVNVKHIQTAGSTREHFDICLSKRAKAIKMGATEITMRELGEMVAKRKNNIAWHNKYYGKNKK